MPQERKSERVKDNPDYRALHEGRDVITPTTDVTKISTASKLTLTPPPKNPDKSGDFDPIELEKKALNDKLKSLATAEKRLKEQEELFALRRQVHERELYIQSLEKSVSTVAGVSDVSNSDMGIVGGARPKTKIPIISSGSSTEVRGFHGTVLGRKGTTEQADTSGSKGTTQFNINTLRDMPNLRNKARKELKSLGVVLHSSSSDSDSSNSSERSISSGSSDVQDFDNITRNKKHKKHKHKNKSGITSKASDSVKVKQKYPHSNLRFDFVSRNITFDKLEFNLFIAGELEIISSSKINPVEKEGRILLLKKLMYLNSSYEFSVIKSLYAAILREIELGLGSWGDDFTYVETAVLSRYRIRTKNQSEPVLQLRPRYSSSQTNVFQSNFGGHDDTKIWFCSKYQRNKCSFKSSHVVTTKNGKSRFAKHICASCWQLDKKELDHPECSSACPHTSG